MNSYVRNICLFLCIIAPHFLMANVDYVIFSFDRPMQLYSLLESSERYLSGLNETHVIYRASGQEYEEGYQEVAARFSWAQFHKQGPNPKEDFKPLTLHSAFSSTSQSPYVLFAVDDIIVTDSVDLNACTAAMEKYGAWGFYLRLGKNITRCYMLNIETPIPAGRNRSGEFFTWRFQYGKGDWNYPNTVDQTIYRKQDIEPFFRYREYIHPNSLESRWASEAKNYLRGICYARSKNINLPLNLVNPSTNKCENLYTPEDLLRKFHEGWKIDIAQFRKVKNISPHVDYKPLFIKR